MDFIHTYAKEIVALLVPVITWVLNGFLRGRARLRVAQPHAFTFLIQEPLRDADGKVLRPTQTVQTRSFLIQNDGRETATKLELVFNWQPMCLNLWPSRHMTEHEEADGRYVVILDSLAPAEVLGCEVLSVNGDVPELINVRSDQTTGQRVNMYPQPVVGKGLRFVAGTLMFVGLATAVYALILLLQFLVLKTPLGR